MDNFRDKLLDYFIQENYKQIYRSNLINDDLYYEYDYYNYEKLLMLNNIYIKVKI